MSGEGCSASEIFSVSIFGRSAVIFGGLISTTEPAIGVVSVLMIMARGDCTP